MKTRNYLSITMILMFISGTLLAQQPVIQNFRAYNKSGLGVFEAKKDSTPFDGIKVRVGGGFAQQYQALDHSNTAVFVADKDSNNVNQLIPIYNDFGLAMANLMFDVQLADGISLNLTTYLSAKHHNEAWVKGGYVQIDKLTMFKSDFIDNAMKHMRFKMGHMEINYGDQHYRRTDGGNAIYNRLVGNYLMDAFATEVAAEVYYFNKSITVMGAISNGLIKGDLTKPNDVRQPAFYGKLAWDKQVNNDFRIRLAGSFYMLGQTSRNTLYGGDRTGSRYNYVLENQFATYTGNAFSGRINPDFSLNINAYQVNAFAKFKGLEVFATYETSNGHGPADKTAPDVYTKRTWNQMAIDLSYGLGKEERLYVVGRYNTCGGKLAGATGADVTVDRIQAGLGWYFTDNILAKFEYVTQTYNGFAPTDIRNGGKFNGFMIEGAIAF